MSLHKIVTAQRDFSGGEIDETAERRDDTKIFLAAVKQGQNLQALDTGAARRRFGRRVRYFDGGLHDIVHPTGETEFDVTFADQRFTARLTNGSIVSNITGAPWTDAILRELSWEEFGRHIFVTHRTIPTQLLEFDPDAGTWSLFPFTFRTLLNGALAEPFYRFADFGETMTPSARTGTITLVTSADVFEDGHVGVRFTWVKKQVEITTVTDARNATATVIETLPPTYDVTVDSVEGYVIGEEVDGSDSNTKGELIAIDTGAKKLTIIIISGFNGYATAEYVVGGDGRGKVTAQAEVSPGASVQWEEALISPVRGYPGTVATDAQRLIFCDLAQFEQGILWSGVNRPDDFSVSGDADGAIFDYVTSRCRVLFVIGGADEIVITDRGVFYIPISAATRLAPGSVEFRRISTDSAAKVRPAAFPDGVVFVGSTQTRLIAVVGTGQVARPYVTKPLTTHHTHLFSEVISLAVSDDSAAAVGGRYIYAANSDGTAVVGRYDETADWIGWYPWTGVGVINSIVARYGEVIMAVTYVLETVSVDTVEVVDPDALMDGMIDLDTFVGTDPIKDSTGEAILDSTGEPIYASSGALVPFGETNMDAMDGDFYLGQFHIHDDGEVHIHDELVAEEDLSSVSLGFAFTVIVKPLLPSSDAGEDRGQRMKRRKIARGAITVRDTQSFEVNGQVHAGFLGGEDMETDRPLRDATYRFRTRGRSFDPPIEIIQATPGHFTLIELAAEVTV